MHIYTYDGWATYLKAFELDELLDSVDDENIVVVIHVPYVAGMEPTVDVHGSCSGLGIIQVP